MTVETQEKKFRLPKEFAKKWITALRSGEYKQGNGVLFDGDCYCCLGIAGKLCGYSNKKMWQDAVLNPDKYKKVPDEIKSGKELQARLADMNDDGTDFPQIADWIEQNVELY